MEEKWWKKVLRFLALPVGFLLGLFISKSSRRFNSSEHTGAADQISEQLKRDSELSGESAGAIKSSAASVASGRERIEEGAAIGERIGELARENIDIVSELQRRATERDQQPEEK